jgi:hypothetical protein
MPAPDRAVKSAVINRCAVLFSGLNHCPVLELKVLPPEPVPKANLTSDTVKPANVISNGARADNRRFVMLSPGGLVGC